MNVDVPAAKQVLHVFGDYSLGTQPRRTMVHTIRGIRCAIADQSPAGRDDLRRFETEWPSYVTAVRMIVRAGEDDLEPLREYVKAQMDKLRRARGL